MQANKIAYEPEHIDNIIKNYKKCVERIQDLRSEINDLNSIFNITYEGQAKKGLQETIIVLTKHIDIFLECCQNTEKYVTNAKKEAINLDKAIGRKILQGTIKQR